MTNAENNEKPTLSERQIEVLRAVSKGLSNQEIAKDLDISVNTVRVHLRNIFEKIGAQSRTEATMWAIEARLIVPDGLNTPQAEATDQLSTIEVPAIIEPTRSRLPSLSLWQKRYVTVAFVLALFFLFTPVIKSTLSPNDDGKPPAQFENRWSIIAEMPTSRSGLALVYRNNEFYVIGGTRTSGPTGLVEIYDRETDSWREGASKPTATTDIQAVTISDEIYIAGGCDGDQQAKDMLEIFDPAKDQWRTGPNLPTSLCGYAAATLNQNLYLIGGWNGHQYVDTVYIYSVADEVWLKHESAYPLKVGYAAAATFDDTLYVAGGFNGENDVGNVYRLVLESGEWQESIDLEHPRAGLGVTSVNNTLFAIGGGWHTNLRSNENLNLTENQWKEIDTPYFNEWRNFGLSQDEANIYVAGGWHGEHLNLLAEYEASFKVFLPVLQ